MTKENLQIGRILTWRGKGFIRSTHERIPPAFNPNMSSELVRGSVAQRPFKALDDDAFRCSYLDCGISLDFKFIEYFIQFPIYADKMQDKMQLFLHNSQSITYPVISVFVFLNQF